MNKFFYILVGIIVALISTSLITQNLGHVRIIAQFQELEPFNKKLPVYYKGYKLGHTGNIYPSKDFTNTNVDIILKIKDLDIPDNATVKIKSKNKKDYIELIYPNTPSVTYLKNRSIIKGEKSLDISSYISKQAESGGLDEIKDNLNSTVQSAGITLNALTELINTANLILIDIRPSIKETSINLATSTKNLSDVTNQLDKSMQPKRLSNTLSNIEKTTKNLEIASLNIAGITDQANTKTITLLDCILTNTNALIKNIDNIVNGIKNTLSKRFGGMQIMLGKPIKE